MENSLIIIIMIEIKNRFYTQRFYATELKAGDFFKAVIYTKYMGDKTKIPFWYRQIPGHTGCQSLQMSDEELLNVMKSNTRNEVRRAIKEGCSFDIDANFDQFVSYYNRFAKEKHLASIDSGLLKKYDRMVITSSSYNVGGGKITLSMHATLFSKEDRSATLMYSCSPRLEDGVDRKLIGWANRFLHYRDFILFRDMGAERYEWNGINMNPETPERYSIGKFKLGFGCEPEESIGLKTPLFILLHYIRYNLFGK